MTSKRLKDIASFINRFADRFRNAGCLDAEKQARLAARAILTAEDVEIAEAIRDVLVRRWMAGLSAPIQGGAGASEYEPTPGASFDGAIDTVLENEGGYVSNPNDPGGETNYGISQREHPTLDIRNLTRDQAAGILRQEYWHYDGIRSQAVATKVFDMAVNMGPGTADRYLQESLGALGEDVTVDGVAGSETKTAVNQVDSQQLLQQLRDRAAAHYQDIAARDPSKKQFLGDWLRRAAQ